MRQPDYEAAARQWEAEFPCVCDDAYTDRGLIAPDCDHHYAEDGARGIVDAAYPAPPDTEERLRFLVEMDRHGQALIAANSGEPEDWSDAAKLRLNALYLDKFDLDRGVYHRTGVQKDLRRIADRIEELGDVW